MSLWLSLLASNDGCLSAAATLLCHISASVTGFSCNGSWLNYSDQNVAAVPPSLWAAA